MSVRSLCVCGGGQMGLGIAYVAAVRAGLRVELVDVDSNAQNRAKSFFDKLLSKDLAKGKLEQAKADEAKERVKFSDSLKESIRDVDFFIEAVPEILSAKEQIFKSLPGIASPHTALASNTSSISITKLAAFCRGAEHRVLGFHMFNPVPVMTGVEIISGLQTSPETESKAFDLARQLDKSPSKSADRPGFIANKLLVPYLNHAIRLLEQGVGDRDSIDNIMKNGCNMPMGPLALADMIGLDTCKEICTQIGIEPSDLLIKMLDAGWLGKKSGKGFYEY